MNTTDENVSTNSTICACDFATSLNFALATNILNLILGCPTNGYVLWLIFRGAGGTIASEFFILNFTVNELLSCVCGALTIIWITQKRAVFQYAVFFFNGFETVGRPLFQTCICLERYLAVVHPVVFLRYKPLRYRLACCGLLWVLLVLFSSCFALMNGSMFYLFFVLVLYPNVVLLHLFCCLSILRALKRPGPGEGEREKGSAVKMKAFKIISLILTVMLTMYLPFIIISFLERVLCLECFHFALNTCASFTTVCGCIQPFLYLYKVGKLPCLNLAH